MPDQDSIAEASITLVGDANAFMDTLEAAKSGVERLAEEMDAALRDVYDRILNISEMSDAEFGKFIAEQAAAAGKGIDEFVESLVALGVEMGRSAEDAVALGNAYKDDLAGKLADAMAAARFEAEQLGYITKETKQDIEELQVALDKATSSNSKLANATNQSAQATKDQGGFTALADAALGKVGLSVRSLAAGTAVATLAVKAFNEAYKEIQEGVQTALKFDDLQRKLQISVRAAQRQMGEQAGTIKEWNDFASELSSTFGVLQSKVMAMTAQAVRIGAQFNLTREQTQDLTRAALVMSETFGGDATRNMNLLVQYITGGRTSSALQRLGLNLSTAALDAKTFTMNLGHSYKALDAAEKQAVRYALVMEQVNVYTEDVIASSDTLSGRMASVATETEKASNAIGTIFAPLKVELAEVGVTVKQIFAILMIALGEFAATAGAVIKTVFDSLWQLGEALVGFDWKHPITSLKEAFNELQTDDWNFGDALYENFLVAQKAVRGWQGLGDEANQAGAAIASAAEQAAADASAAFDEMEADLLELTAAYEQAGQDIETEFGRKMEDLAVDIARRQQDAYTDLMNDLADIDYQAAGDREQAIIENQDAEIRIKEDHWRRLKELERQYLFDLQDAVRERDARAVLELQRKYNLERTKENEDYELRQQRREREFQIEMEDIERQRIRKQQQRYAEYLAELEEIALQEQRKREEYAVWRQRQFEDRETDFKRQFAQLVADIAEASGLTGLAFDAFIQLIGNKLGPNSPFTGYLDYARQYAYQTVKAIAASFAALGGSVTTPANVPFSSFPAWKRATMEGGFATGGDFIATSPQMITVGERPERISIQPLNRATGEAAGNMGRQGGGGRGGGRVEVAVKLSEGLEGAIVDQAMAEVADVFVTIQRGDRAAPAGGGRR